ncbi:asparagine synthase (glutamine-hydrolyzing) [uncultured Thiohalocapsa sp.]|uniref:asparagine synthase (glutamine-hydrolyzing) n=1 Tax=uncultured Thiohalocapsa sp. TaxID=768990 RepID=UPI0025EDDF21|nr:asparagine synthase (glutamine-hydrolyzing) [uncultured Thiohalocapsa sp.]
MCGIAGFIRADGAPPEPDQLAAMRARLAHRGPDDQGTVVLGPVGLAQTRLSIIGLESGHQPMLSDDGQWALVANGEIYNYPELDATLARAMPAPARGSDSATILHAYAVHGAEAVAHLRGMYAFALYDHGERRLLLVRDRLGIKPLFYIRLPDRVAFASELKALLPLLPAQPEVHAPALRQFLLQQFSTGRETIIAGIERVLPGEMLSIDADLRIAHHRYWSPREALVPAPLDAEDAAQALDALLDQVMREHMRADVPYGLFLSGGLDSATLAAALAEHGAGRIRSFSVGWRGTRMADELDGARRIADWFGFEHHALTLEPAQVFARLPHSVWAADDLMRDYACLPTSVLAQTAATSLKVVFSGEGGDEVFAGYRRYRPAAFERLGKGLLFPGSGGFRTRPQWSPHWIRRLFGARLRALPGRSRQPFVDAWQSAPPAWTDLQRRQYTDLVTALPDNLLVKTDRMLMAFGLEGRVPLLDHRLVAFGLALPDGLKRRGRTGKWLLRRWAAPRLPAGHLDRPKRGFHVPVADWLNGDNAARIGPLLQRHRGVREWFDSDAIPALVAARRAGRGGERELFGLLQFAIWYGLFVEGAPARPRPDEDVLDWIADAG